jgi:hypothetical protein
MRDKKGMPAWVGRAINWSEGFAKAAPPFLLAVQTTASAFNGETFRDVQEGLDTFGVEDFLRDADE